MSRNSDGLVAVKVEKIWPSRRSCRAAAMTPFITEARVGGSCPSSASSSYSKPPVVASPMIGGRLTAMMLAERIPAARPNTRPISAFTLVCTVVRSAKGLSRTNMKPLFGSWLESRIE